MLGSRSSPQYLGAPYVLGRSIPRVILILCYKPLSESLMKYGNSYMWRIQSKNMGLKRESENKS